MTDKERKRLEKDVSRTTREIEGLGAYMDALLPTDLAAFSAAVNAPDALSRIAFIGDVKRRRFALLALAVKRKYGGDNQSSSTNTK